MFKKLRFFVIANKAICRLALLGGTGLLFLTYAGLPKGHGTRRCLGGRDLPRRDHP
jgi:hypothetical protein